MGSVRRAPRTRRWEARYRDPAGVSRTRTFDRKADAQAFLSRVAVELQRGEWRDPALGRILLHEWVASWWSTTTNLRLDLTRFAGQGWCVDHAA
jgi:hypothetical protein